MELMNNVLYIRKEIPNVTLPPGIGNALNEACDELITAKFDIVSDLHDLDEQLAASSVNLAQSPTVKRILARLDEAAILLHPLVVALGEAAASDERYHLAYLLVAESAVNLLNTHAAIPRPDTGPSND